MIDLDNLKIEQKITTYEDEVIGTAEVKHELDIVVHPQLKRCGKAFKKVFESQGPFTASDFKLVADAVRGSSPNPDDESEEETASKIERLAYKFANVAKLLKLLDNETLERLMYTLGVTISVMSPLDESKPIVFGDDDEKEFTKLLRGSAIDGRPKTNVELLEALVKRTNELQDIVDENKGMIDNVAGHVEDKFEIKKSNFKKAVTLEAVALTKSHEKMLEKAKKVFDNIENLERALDPISKQLEKAD